MYRQPVFAEDRRAVLHAMMRAHPLATLVTDGPSGLMPNLVPFMLLEGGGRELLRTHFSRVNPQLAEVSEDAEALVVFQGSQA